MAISRRHRPQQNQVIAPSGGVSTWLRTALLLIRSDLHETENKNDKIELCDFLLHLFRMELRAYSQTQVFINPDCRTSIASPVSKYYSETGKEVRIQSKNDRIISLGDICVDNLARTDKVSRLLPSIKRDGFNFDKCNHEVSLYEPLGIAVVDSGRHSLAVSTYYDGNAEISATVYDLTEMFMHTDVDCYGWINVHTGERYEVIADMNDAYIALIYYIARIRYLLQNDYDLDKEAPATRRDVVTVPAPKIIAAYNDVMQKERIAYLESKQLCVDGLHFEWKVVGDFVVIYVKDKHTETFTAELVMDDDSVISVSKSTFTENRRLYQMLYYAELCKDSFK